MTISGLPVHVLLVHLVVVLLPLTAAAAALASVWPAAQRKLTFLIPLGALVGAIAAPVTIQAGKSLATTFGNPPFLDSHRTYGQLVLPWALALLVTTALQYAYWRQDRPRDGWQPKAISAVVILAAIGTTGIVVLTGDSGARAVWESRI